MCWADRLALVWAGFIAFAYLLICHGNDGIDPVFWHGLPILMLWVVAPLWLLLRGLRWTFHRGA